MMVLRLFIRSNIVVLNTIGSSPKGALNTRCQRNDLPLKKVLNIDEPIALSLQSVCVVYLRSSVNTDKAPTIRLFQRYNS